MRGGESPYNLPMSGLDLESVLLPAVRACAGQRLCVGFSGGLDSTVLLHLLARLAPAAGCALAAVHVHHGLNPNADAWAAHCEAVCVALGVPLRVERVTVAGDAGKGLEAAARVARHAVFAAQEADWIVLAHHADDQAETLLHRLVRGAGVVGAAAMRERDASRRLWRPLLGVARAELQAWAQAQDLSWIEDDSNADLRFTRNFLRHQILAPLTAHFPAAPANLGRACRHFAEAADLLQALAAEDAVQVRLGEAGARSRLRALSPARARNLLRHWLALRGVSAPDAARLEALLQGLAGTGAVRWVLADLAVCAYHEALWLEPAESALPRPLVWCGEAVLPWGAGSLHFLRASGEGALRLDPQTLPLEILTRRGGERMRLGEGRPMRSFKALCQEHGIPAWQRDRLPLLWCGGALVWIGGIGAAAQVRGGAGEAGWRIVWQPGGRASPG